MGFELGMTFAEVVITAKRLGLMGLDSAYSPSDGFSAQNAFMQKGAERLEFQFSFAKLQSKVNLIQIIRRSSFADGGMTVQSLRAALEERYGKNFAFASETRDSSNTIWAWSSDNKPASKTDDEYSCRMGTFNESKKSRGTRVATKAANDWIDRMQQEQWAMCVSISFGVTPLGTVRGFTTTALDVEAITYQLRAMEAAEGEAVKQNNQKALQEAAARKPEL